MVKNILSNKFIVGVVCFLAILFCTQCYEPIAPNTNTIIFVPTYTEVGQEWIVSSGYERIDQNDSLPAFYRKDNVLIAITGVGLDMTRQSMQELQALPLPYADKVDMLLTGTVGSYTVPVHTVVDCKSSFKKKNYDYHTVSLVCVHEFVSADNPHPELQAPDVCFDMESEAFIDELKKQDTFGVNTFSILKVVSDGGDGSELDWETATIKFCRPKIQHLITEFITQY